MSQTTFTPGPWAPNTLAGRPNSEVFSVDDVLICDCRGTNVVMELEEIESNARLIAAAPDLLAALKAYEALDEQRNTCEECEERLEMAPEACELCFPFADDARLKMRAAIAKAEGRA